MHSPDDSPNIKRNHAGRALGVVLCLALPAAFIASLIWSVVKPGAAWFAGAWWLAFAGFIAALNLYLAIGRPLVYKFRNGTFEGYKWSSSVPVMGTLGLIPAAFVGWGATGTAILGLLICCIDFGGLPWFLWASWKDRSFWDQRAGEKQGGEGKVG